MRFVLVGCAPRLGDQRQWRATHVKEKGGYIDVFFWTDDDVEKARALVLARYPAATFSDQEPFNAVRH